MRDHLLGCQAFLPPEPEPQDRTIHLKRRFPLGVPERKYRQMEIEMVKAIEDKQKITAFEDFDHTPPEMQADFPREYDLMTMLNETASRLTFPYHKGVLVPEEYEALSRFYDAELQRLCDIK
ncbi:MAG: hypothetical protein AB7F22_05270 [Reyranella sp.]|uniref:hypothetical protein n=1 Tax=Reyranella sp. TaxID=1929291 RepID=UPI003D09C5F7